MKTDNRKFLPHASQSIRNDLAVLADRSTSVADYQAAMRRLGSGLASCCTEAAARTPILVVSTAEDADFLTQGYLDVLKQQNIPYKLAVFWNHHYSLENGQSVAPIVHSYLEEGYRDCRQIVLLKSIISGSCVVKTNLIALLDTMPLTDIGKIEVAAPVMYEKGKESLRKAFPVHIADKFRFHTFALDAIRGESGEVVPGIGGEVYPRLGLNDQPAKLRGYMPALVAQSLFA